MYGRFGCYIPYLRKQRAVPGRQTIFADEMKRICHKIGGTQCSLHAVNLFTWDQTPEDALHAHRLRAEHVLNRVALDTREELEGDGGRLGQLDDAVCGSAGEDEVVALESPLAVEGL